MTEPALPTEPVQAPEPVEPTEPVQAPEPVDPKEAMRRALEHKQQQAHDAHAQSAEARIGGKPHHQAGGKRMFRRKAGS